MIKSVVEMSGNFLIAEWIIVILFIITLVFFLHFICNFNEITKAPAKDSGGWYWRKLSVGVRWGILICIQSFLAFIYFYSRVTVSSERSLVESQFFTYGLKSTPIITALQYLSMLITISHFLVGLNSFNTVVVNSVGNRFSSNGAVVSCRNIGIFLILWLIASAIAYYFVREVVYMYMAKIVALLAFIRLLQILHKTFSSSLFGATPEVQSLKNRLFYESLSNMANLASCCICIYFHYRTSYYYELMQSVLEQFITCMCLSLNIHGLWSNPLGCCIRSRRNSNIKDGEGNIGLPDINKKNAPDAVETTVDASSVTLVPPPVKNPGESGAAPSLLHKSRRRVV